MEKDLPTIGSLPIAVRTALSEATGLVLDEQQQFYIVLVKPRDEQQRQGAVADIQQIARQAEAAITASGMTPEEFDRLADEVCDEVRHGPQP